MIPLQKTDNRANQPKFQFAYRKFQISHCQDCNYRRPAFVLKQTIKVTPKLALLFEFAVLVCE